MTKAPYFASKCTLRKKPALVLGEMIFLGQSEPIPCSKFFNQ